MKPLSLFDFASLPRRASRPALLGACAAATWCHVSLASDEPRVYTDPAGDAVLRRTDPGADGLVHPDAGWPDYVRVAYGGWQTNTPASNPYNGSWRDARDTNLLRIDLVFHGLVNPPGPLNLRGEGYDPYLYGMNPLYGYVEFDLDSDRDTGGEIDDVRNRPLGNLSRFGGRLDDSLGQRAAVSAFDFDGNLLTEPFVERSGEEMHLAFCACSPMTIDPLNDPTPATFDAGDTWIVSSRFLRRTHAFSRYSAAFGGSAPGEYDPVVRLRFQHNTQTDQTTVTLVYGLDNSGAAALRGEAVQPIDLNAGNQTSILEMLNDIRFAAVRTSDPGVGTPYDLLREWRDNNHAELEEFLRADSWTMLALFGTAYAIEEPEALFVWTDVGPGFNFGDCTGDGFVTTADVQSIQAAIGQTDGTSFDADRRANGQTRLVDFGPNFALFDLNYDGVINSLDVAMIGTHRLGDVNNNGSVEIHDLTLLRAMRGLGSGHLLFNPAADLNNDLRIDSVDEELLIRQMIRSHW